MASGESVEEGKSNPGEPPIFDGAAESYLGYGSSDEEFAEEGEVTLVGTDGEESLGNEPAQGKRRHQVVCRSQTRSRRGKMGL